MGGPVKTVLMLNIRRDHLLPLQESKTLMGGPVKTVLMLNIRRDHLLPLQGDIAHLPLFIYFLKFII
jgi:hypothetical protein